MQNFYGEIFCNTAHCFTQQKLQNYGNYLGKGQRGSLRTTGSLKFRSTIPGILYQHVTTCKQNIEDCGLYKTLLKIKLHGLEPSCPILHKLSFWPVVFSRSNSPEGQDQRKMRILDRKMNLVQCKSKT